MKIKVALIFFIGVTILSISLSSCFEREPEPVMVEHFIDNRLRPYFETFQEEAANRGIEINFRLSKVDGYIQSIPENGVAGQCQSHENDFKAVVVQPIYWDNISEENREFLIFHELGHCILNREHFDEANNDGTCKSIMNSGGLFCDINYNSRTRDAYIDELFFE